MSQEFCWDVGWLAWDQACQPAALAAPQSVRIAVASAAMRLNAVEVYRAMIAPAVNTQTKHSTLLRYRSFAEIFQAAARQRDRTQVPFNCRKQEFPRGIPTSSQDEYFPPWIAAFSGRRSCCSATLSDASSSEIVSLRSDDSTSANRRMCHVRIRIIMQTGFNIP